MGEQRDEQGAVGGGGVAEQELLPEVLLEAEGAESSDDEDGDEEAAEAPEALNEEEEEDDEPTPPGPELPGWLVELVRAQGEALGEAVRGRRLGKEATKEARVLLRSFFAFEAAGEGGVRGGVALVRAAESLLRGGESPEARFAAWLSRRVLRRWPVTVPCLERAPMDQAGIVAEAMSDERLDRIEAIFRLLQLDEQFALRDVKPKPMAPFDGPDREIVRKQGSS